MSTASIVTLVCVLAVGACSVALYTQNQALNERLEALEAQRVAVESLHEGPSDALPGLGASETVQELQMLHETVNALALRISAAEQDVADQSASGAAAGSDTDSPAFDEAVREIVLNMTGDVRFRTKLGLTGSPNLPKKPAFARLAEVLKLDASQEDSFRKDLVELQQDVFALLAEERDDGVVLFEEIAKAEELGEGDPRRAEIFIKIFTLTIPGTDETYMKRVVEWSTAMRKRTQRYLRAEQTEIFNAIDVDLLGVKLD